MKAALSESDMALAIDFIDGKLETAERTRFELRLASDPALARAVEELFDTDHVLRKLEPVASPARQRRLRTWVWIGSLAAGALCLFGLAKVLRAPSERLDCRIALVPSFESASAFVDSQPELAGLRPPGLDTLRSGSASVNVGAAEFAAKARGADAQLFAALDRPAPAPSPPPTAGYFVIPFRTSEACSVVVLGLASAGPRLRLFPERDDVRPVGERARVAAGDHVLPKPRIELHTRTGSGATVDYNRGFLVPVGARSMEVLVAARRQPLDADVLDAIDRALAADTAAGDVERLLDEHGFTTQRAVILEPKD